MGETGCGGVVEVLLGDLAPPGSFVYDMWWLVVGVGVLLVVCVLSLISSVFPPLNRMVKEFSRLPIYLFIYFLFFIF